MLGRSQEKKIRSLRSAKGREKHGLCLVEGGKAIETAGNAVLFTFSSEDTPAFDKLVTTETPQDIAGVASIPEWSLEDVGKYRTVVVLDGVQDPGNAGAILRLCLGFDASLILVESADATAPKVVRASAGAMFHVPWVRILRDKAVTAIKSLNRPIYRLERIRGKSVPLSENGFIADSSDAVLIAGSEGRGILLDIPGETVSINHKNELESLNVGHALAIVLQARYSNLER